MFYDIFTKICEEKKTTAAQVRRDLDIGQSTMASWKSKGLTPNATTVARLAEYFNVSVDYLLGKEDYPAKVSERMRNDTLQILNILDLPPQEQLQFDKTFTQFLKAQKVICEGIWKSAIFEKLSSLATDEEFAEFFSALQAFSVATKKLEEINPEGIHLLRAKYKSWNDNTDTLIKIFSIFNDEGQRKAIEWLKDMSEIPRFQRRPSQQE